MMHRDADQLLICEGSCRRLFHYPCAGLSKPPAEEESYICQDCRKGSHVCALCQNYGTDNEDVFPCCATKCGLYYHEACLQLRDVEIRLVPTVIPPSTSSSSSSSLSSTGPDDGNDETKSVPHSDAVGTHWLRREFKCPAHCCWTCTQKDLVEKERKETAESRKGGKKKGRKKSKPVNASFGQKTDQLTIVSTRMVYPYRHKRSFCTCLEQLLTVCEQQLSFLYSTNRDVWFVQTRTI